MKINIFIIGKNNVGIFSEATKTYLNRVNNFVKTEIIVVKDSLKSDDASKSDIEYSLKKNEITLEKHMLGKYNICMSIESKQLNSNEFSSIISKIHSNSSYSEINFFIGGSHGLSEGFKKKCNLEISFSKLTFPHKLFLVMLLEQIFRSFKIINNQKYHK